MAKKRSKRKTARPRPRKQPSPTLPAVPSPGANTAGGATASGAAGGRVTVRHYCQGIGDCHLLRFPKQGGGDFFMLIDCGIHSSVTGGTDTIRKIVDDLASVTRHIDIVVATHEHWDHVSGFMTAADNFKKISFGEAWMAWTENPADTQAAQLDKFKGQAIAALQASGDRLGRASALAPHLAAVRDGVDSVLGFHFGAKGERVRDARNAILQMTKNKVRYLESKDSPLSLPGVGNLRIYVLGPPRDAQLLGLTERASEMYGPGSPGGSPLAVALSDALMGEVKGPESDYARHSTRITAPCSPNCLAGAWG